MTALFRSGGAADLVLAVTILEGLVLTGWHRRTGRGLAPDAILAMLLPGLFLVLALRGALLGAWWGWIALPLLAAFPAHMADLRRRWQG